MFRNGKLLALVKVLIQRFHLTGVSTLVQYIAI